MCHCEPLYPGITAPPVPSDSVSRIEEAEETSRQTTAATDLKEGDEGVILPAVPLRVDQVVQMIQTIRMKATEEDARLDGRAPLAIQAIQATQTIRKTILVAGGRPFVRQNIGKSTIRSL